MIVSSAFIGNYHNVQHAAMETTNNSYCHHRHL